MFHQSVSTWILTCDSTFGWLPHCGLHIGITCEGNRRIVVVSEINNNNILFLEVASLSCNLARDNSTRHRSFPINGPLKPSLCSAVVIGPWAYWGRQVQSRYEAPAADSWMMCHRYHRAWNRSRLACSQVRIIFFEYSITVDWWLSNIGIHIRK